MPKIVPPARHGVAVLAALASFAVLAAPIQRAVGAGSAPVTVTNPQVPVTVVNPEIPVTVVNPATSPALTSSADDPGRIAYQSHQILNCTGLTNCDILFPVVPPGHRLVVQHVVGGLNLSGTPTRVQVILSSSTGAFSAFFAPFAGTVSFFDQLVLLYFDGGEAPRFDGFSAGTSFGVQGSISLAGYLLDCTAIPCAAIAH
jgi:hypothetical protein